MEPFAVFISYARNDSYDFAHKLKDALENKGKTVWIDSKSIDPASLWETEIEEGIEGSIAVLAIISPESMNSTACEKERKHAVDHGKKIIPVLYKRPLHKTQFEHQYIDLTSDKDFEDKLAVILNAIDTDLEWKKEHTLLDIRFSQWHRSGGKDARFLLRDSELKSIEVRRKRISPHIKPYLTDEQRQFLLESRKAEESRQRTRTKVTIGILGVTGFLCFTAIVGGVIAYIQSRNASQSAQANATAQIVAGEKGNMALAQELAAQAQQLYDKQDSSPTVATLLAIESAQRFPNAAADEVIRKSLSALLPTEQIIPTSHTADILSFAFSPDGNLIATGGSDRTARIWDQRSGAEISTLNCTGNVTAVKFSPDSRYVYIACDDGAIGLWEAATGEQVFSDFHSQYAVFDLSANGETAVSSGEDGVVRIWDTAARSLKTDFRHGSPVKFVAASPDGTRIASVGADSVVKVWDSQSPILLSEKPTDSYFAAVEFSPDNRLIISNDAGPNSILWDVETGEETNRYEFNSVIEYIFSPDDEHIAVREVNAKKVDIWNLKTGQLVQSLPHDFFVFSAAFNPDGTFLASGDMEGTIKIWDIATGHEVDRALQSGPAGDLTFSPNGLQIASVDQDKVIHLWPIPIPAAEFSLRNAGNRLNSKIDPTGRWIVSLDPNESALRISDVASNIVKARIENDASLTAMKFSSDGGMVITGDEKGTTCVWKVPTGEKIVCFFEEGRVNVVTTSPDLKFVAGVQNTGLATEYKVAIWNIQSAEKVLEVTPGFVINSVTFGHDSKLVAIAGIESYVSLWNIDSQTEVGRLEDYYPLVQIDAGNEIVFSPNGKWLISNGAESARVWDLNGFEEISRLTYNHDEFYNLAAVLKTIIRPDQSKLASVNTVSLRNITLDSETKREATIRIWDPISGEDAIRMVHNSWVNDIVWSPDGRYLLSGGWDGIVRIWDASNGNEVGRITHDSAVTQLQFTPDGNQVVSISDDGNYRISYWNPDDIILEGCLRVTRNLSLLEWSQYFGDAPYHATCSNLPPGK